MFNDIINIHMLKNKGAKKGSSIKKDKNVFYWETTCFSDFIIICILKILFFLTLIKALHLHHTSREHSTIIKIDWFIFKPHVLCVVCIAIEL